MTDADADADTAADAAPAADTTLSFEQSIPDEAVLAVEDIESGYGELQVLYDVSMFVEPEEIVCIIGPNGAGKSTVLKTIFGLLEPWSGTVRVGDREISGLAPEDVVRAGVGYVPQTENVFETLTVRENLLVGGVARDDAADTIQALRDRFSLLDEKWTTKAADLSGGQRQILALARALVMDPDVLLVDEPSAGLAPSIVEDVLAELRRINELGTAILMIEQNARQGLSVSDRGYVMSQGEVRFVDDADAVLTNPKIRELYLGG